MSDKLFYLLDELKDNFSRKALTEVISTLDGEAFIEDIFDNQIRARNAFNGQDINFYNELSILFLNDLNESPEMYFIFWEPIIGLLNNQEKSILLQQGLENHYQGDADDYINGMKHLDNGSPEIALFYFKRIDHYIAYYFNGICYLETENNENSIIEFNIFIKNLNETLKIPTLENEIGLTLAKWNTLNDLGYLYNRIEEYQRAKESYKAGLEIFNFEDTYEINNQQNIEDNFDDFNIWVNNYLLALEKTNSINECIKVLKYVLIKRPDNYYFQCKLFFFEQKEKNSNFPSNIPDQLFKKKQPFNIQKFESIKLISKEKALEDLIVEQIKYGFKVFGKSLEVYKSEYIFGRQYYISSVNGILDLLLIDKFADQLYIVELKRNEAGIEVVEQIEKYIDGLSKELNINIKGIICLHKPDTLLADLVKTKENIELYTYEFEFKKIE